MATSSKRQEFRVIGISGGDMPLFIFHETAIGGREDYLTFFVYLLKDEPIVLVRPNIYMDHKDTDAHKILESLPFDSLSKLDSAKGVFRIDSAVSVTSPAKDSAFVFGFPDKEPGFQTAAYWNGNCITNCADDPIFQGAEYERIYFYNQGLYKNYKISQVYRDSDATFLVILTETSARAYSNNMMSGLLVFRKVHSQ